MNTNLLRASCAVAALLMLVACDDKTVDPSTQYGKNPVLPAPQQYVLPPMRIALAEGWRTGRTPAVANGLEVKAFATDFMHPRMVYSLPNGDVLVVETNGPKAPIYRPKDFIEGKVKALSGSGAPAGNRIILLRDTKGT
ncbi:MAG TPA: sorbosone dehydrogenase family protein, partial [Acetobacteraceae bacterium]|nr:sorbosone dehydrogenase family protein [Acetobacteraceae bacterium]